MLTRRSEQLPDLSNTFASASAILDGLARQHDLDASLLVVVLRGFSKMAAAHELNMMSAHPVAHVSAVRVLYL